MSLFGQQPSASSSPFGSLGGASTATGSAWGQPTPSYAGGIGGGGYGQPAALGGLGSGLTP